ncbi:VOC family protein [Frankia sp. EAN1pec]|uniref:VOC family protein n=1 Tax=Parafrankia sp. (strain EAN1pec) TaxID=298653 RepID=UPI0018DB5F6D
MSSRAGTGLHSEPPVTRSAEEARPMPANRAEGEVDAMIERARRAGATAVTGPGRQPWGYVGTFADPDGHLWMLTFEAPAD